MPIEPSLTIERRIAAKPEAVFRALTDPTESMRWFGPEGAEPLEAETDPRVGGRYHILFRGPDGEEHGVSGIYCKRRSNTPSLKRPDNPVAPE